MQVGGKTSQVAAASRRAETRSSLQREAREALCRCTYDILVRVSSRLFESAVSLLDPAERHSLEALQEELEATRLSSDRQLVVNLQSEAHLVGDEDFGDAAALESFLRACGSGRGSPGGARTRYESSCLDHQIRGLQIPPSRLPKRLLRYTTSRHLASTLIERVLGIRARFDFDTDLGTSDLFAELAASWDSGGLRGVSLGRSAAIFATFEHPAGAPRADARAMSEALALPFWGNARTGDELLIELSYPAGEVSETRFPTVADAGLMHLFRPAPEVEPTSSDATTWQGWTKPVGPYPPQPEIVHANASATILDRPPRFVGRVPP